MAYHLIGWPEKKALAMSSHCKIASKESLEFENPERERDASPTLRLSSYGTIFFHTKWRTITPYECNILAKMERWASGGASKSESEKGQKRNKSLIDVWRCACDGA